MLTPPFIAQGLGGYLFCQFIYFLSQSYFSHFEAAVLYFTVIQGHSTATVPLFVYFVFSAAHPQRKGGYR